MNNISCKEQDKELLKHFLNRTFFKDWKVPHSEGNKLFGGLELQFKSKCNLGCRYCYYSDRVGFGDQLNPNNIATTENIQENFVIFLDYLKSKNLYPRKIDLFGGEVLNHLFVFNIIDDLIDFYIEGIKKGSKNPMISIPSNMSFLRSDKKVKKIKELKKKAKENGISLCISASVDGKYIDKENRPVVGTQDQDRFYNDEFYDRLFEFAKEVGCGFHPMVHHHQIEKWKDNFLWFQENFKKHNIPWNSLYLLEVRNDGWTKDKINHFIEFYKFVLNWVLYDILEGDKEKFVKGFLLNGIDGYKNLQKMNLFNNTGTIGRGLGCSLQTTFHMRLGDLVVNSCHRLSYDMFNGFRFSKKDGKIFDIEPLNLPFYFSTISTNHKEWPYCSTCMIKDICMSGCLGSQYESTGDPYTPIPSVCALEHGKVRAQVEFFEENNFLESYLGWLKEEQAEAFRVFQVYKNGGKI